MWNARKTGNTLSGKWILRFFFFFAVWLYMVKTPAPNCMSFDPDSSVGKDSSCKCRRPQFDFWVGKIRWRRDRLPTPVFLGFPCGSDGKESTCNMGGLGSIPGLGRSPGEGKGYPFTGVDWRIPWANFTHFTSLHGSLPSPSIRIKSSAVAADLNAPWKGFQGGEQKRGTLCWGKSWQDTSSDS